MDWINLHTSFLDSPEFIGAEPVDRATWVCLLRYCVGQENGGRIVNCKAWGDRKWQQLIRVTLEEVRRTADLWAWDGDDLVVTNYPVEREEEIQAKRLAGHQSGSIRGGAKAEAAKANGAMGGRPPKTRELGKITQAETQAETEAHPKFNPTERKGKGKEGEGEEAETQAPTAEPALPADPQTSPMDILTMHGRHLDYFRGSESGRQEALDKIAAALELYPPKVVSSAILAEFQANRQTVHIRDLLDVIEQRHKPPPEPQGPEPILDMSPAKVAFRARIAAEVAAKLEIPA